MRRKPWLVVILLCLAILVILGFIKFMQIRAAIAFGESFPEPSETVLTHRVNLSDWQPTIGVAGEVRASRELDIRNEVSGIVASVGFESGAIVSKGQLLLQLDDAEEQAQLQAVLADKVLAEQDVERLKGLVKTRAVSQQQADQAAARLAVAKAQEGSIREAIINKRVVAPFDGQAGLHELEVGEFLPAETVITKLVGGLDALWIDFALPQRFASIAIGTPVSIVAEVPGAKPTIARVIAVDPGVSASTRSLQVRALYSNSEQILKPGFFVQVVAPAGARQTVVQVPSTAIRVDAFGNFVYVIEKGQDSKDRAVRRPVKVVSQNADFSIIEEGLQPGELVATQGSFKLREGILVNFDSESIADSALTRPSEGSAITTPEMVSEENVSNISSESADLVDEQPSKVESKSKLDSNSDDEPSKLEAGSSNVD